MIYTNSLNRTVELEVPVAANEGTLEVVIHDGENEYPVDTATYANGKYSVTLPFIVTRNDKEVKVHWRFAYTENSSTYEFEEWQTVEIVTPILPLSEIKKIIDEDSPQYVTDEEAATVERAVRYIIQAHTGQKFGLDRDKVLTVEGHGETALRLPERLVAITGVNTLTSALDARSFIIVSDGWYLKKAWANATPLAEPNGSLFWGDINGSAGPFDNNIYGDYDRSDDSTDTLYGPLSARPGGITVAPGASGRATAWKQDYPFAIRGDWGYKTIPANVKEAARLLVNDYACSEAAYRDRYLESITSADWRLQFSTRSWDSTGNVRADQLLDEYVLLDWAVV